MSPTTSRIRKALAAMCVAAAVVAPTANATDLRSRDGTDGAVMVAPPPYQDLRSPDASDPVVNTSGSYTPASDSSSGSDWDTIGIVAGSVLLAGALGFGLFAASRRRHHKPRVPAISS
jgi:hypothetical protein